MERFKIYTTNKLILEKVAEDYGVKLDYIGTDVGSGYVLCGDTLRVFIAPSHVGMDKEMCDITSQYLPKEKFTL